jgi:site-specific DNA-cytosine methylase
MAEREFTAGFLFAGLGAGARGFLEARARLGADAGRFINLGGIDNDPLACRDFTTLTGGGRALCADLGTMTPAELRREWGDRSPDCVFLSPPCKGFSGLLSTKQSKTPKYEALNRLVLQGIFLVGEAWDRPPALLVLENVPRIQSRGRALLAQVRQLLVGYGYALHEATHDCGEIGGLAQHRRRYLLVARLPAAVPGYIYRPPKQRVKACGSVLGELPMPEDPAAGPLHRLPKLSWLNWVRLALIPPGGDWRDLPRAAPAERRNGSYGVTDWAAPARTVTGESYPSNGSASVADPRLADAIALGATADGARTFKGRPGLFGVNDWRAPAPTVTGAIKVSGGNAPAAVADPRLAIALPSSSDNPNRHHNKYRIVAWHRPVTTVIGATRPGSGALCVADPRLLSPLRPGEERRAAFARWDVRSWEQPSLTVAGSGTNSAFGVADPRTRFGHCDRVTPWDRPAGTVTHSRAPSSGAIAVADSGVQGTDAGLRCRPWENSGFYGVISWQAAAATVTGSASVDNGRFAVADPRKAPPVDRLLVIIADDGTWHRPLTTLELAALQGLPAQIDGAPLQLAGSSVAKWRERVGNCVPVGAARAIAETLLTALVAAATGVWTLGSTGIWVRDDGVTEDEASALASEVA